MAASREAEGRKERRWRFVSSSIRKREDWEDLDVLRTFVPSLESDDLPKAPVAERSVLEVLRDGGRRGLGRSGSSVGEGRYEVSTYDDQHLERFAAKLISSMSSNARDSSKTKTHHHSSDFQRNLSWSSSTVEKTLASFLRGLSVVLVISEICEKERE